MLYCLPGCLQNAECSANLGPSSCKIVNDLQIWDPSEDLEKAPEKALEKAEGSNLEKASGETTGESRFLWRKFLKVTYSIYIYIYTCIHTHSYIYISRSQAPRSNPSDDFRAEQLQLMLQKIHKFNSEKITVDHVFCEEM